MATLADPRIDFTRAPHPAPVPAAERNRAIADPGFGRVFTDHMVTIEEMTLMFSSSYPEK